MKTTMSVHAATKRLAAAANEVRDEAGRRLIHAMAQQYMDDTIERIVRGDRPLPVMKEVAHHIDDFYKEYSPYPRTIAFVVQMVAQRAELVAKNKRRLHKWTFGEEDLEFVAKYVL
jgi:hypothetical protein